MILPLNSRIHQKAECLWAKGNTGCALNANEERTSAMMKSEALQPVEGSGVPSIGILYTDESGRGLTHPFFNPILNAVWDEAAAHGYDITFINRRDSYIDRCRALKGVCLVCVDFSSPAIRELVESDIPCVTVDHLFRGVPAVLSDNESGVRQLVEYAISRGHRRIAFVHGHNNSTVTRARITQFRNTMAYYNLTVPAEYLREGRYDDLVLTRNIVGELLTLPERPTCILLPDDIAYLGAQEAARKLSLSIPDDISFAGYDGIALVQKMQPQLTTILQDGDHIGRTAAKILIELIENPSTARRVPLILPVRFLEGNTISRIEL